MNRQNSSKEGHIPPNIPPPPHSMPQMNSSTISGFLTDVTDSHPAYPGASPVFPSSQSSTTTAASVSSPLLSGQSINLAVELLNLLAGSRRDGVAQQLAQAFHGNEAGLQTLSQQIIALAAAATGSSPSPLSSPLLAVQPVPVSEHQVGNKGKSSSTLTDPAATTTVANVPAAATTTVTSPTALTTDLFSASSGSSESCRIGQLSDPGNSISNRLAGWAARLPLAVASPGVVTTFQNAVAQLALLGLSSPGAHGVDARSCTRAGGGKTQTGTIPGLGLSSTGAGSCAEFASKSDATRATEKDLSTQNGQCQPMDMSEPAFVFTNKEAGGSKVIIRQTADADDHFFKALRGLKVDASSMALAGGNSSLPESKQTEQKRSMDQTSITAALIALDSVQLSSDQPVVVDNGRSDAELAVDEHFKKSLAAFHVSPPSLSSPSLPSVISTNANQATTAVSSINFPLFIPTPLYSLPNSSSEPTPSGLILPLSTLSTMPALNSITTKLQTSKGKCAKIQELTNALLTGVRATNHWPMSSIDSVAGVGTIEQTQSGLAFTADITATLAKDDPQTPQHIAQKVNGTPLITPRTQCLLTTSSGIDTVMEPAGHGNLEKKLVTTPLGCQAATGAHSFKPKKNWLAQYDVRQDDQKLSQLVCPTMPTDNASGEAAATGSHDGSGDRAGPKGATCKPSQSRDTPAQTATLSGATRWTQTDLNYTFDQQRLEKTCSPPVSSLSSGSRSPPSPHSARSSDFECDLKVKSRAKQVAGKQNLRRCTAKHSKRGSGESDPNHHQQRKEKSAVVIVTDNRLASSTSNHSPFRRQRKDKKTIECGIGTESSHPQLPPFQLNFRTKATSISPDRDCIFRHKPGVAAPTRSAVTEGSTGSTQLKLLPPVATSCHTMPMLVSLCSGSNSQGRSGDKDPLKPVAQAGGVMSNSEQRTASVAGAAEQKQDRDESMTEGHNNNNKEASGQPAQMYGTNSKSVSYWALPNTSPVQSFSSSPSPVHREGSATTAVTPISGITSGFFSGSTYSLDSSLGATHIIAFDNSVDTKSINSIVEGRNPCEPKVPTLPGLSSQSGETASQYTTGGVGKSLIEDDGECGELREQKNQSHNQINCIWRKRASSEVSPWSTLKRSRSVITSSSSSAENCDSCDSPSHKCLADVNETLLPTTSGMLATSSRHSMSEIACSTNHIGRCLTPPETMATRDYIGFSNSRSEASGQVQKGVESFDSQLLSSSRCCLRRGSCEPKANNAASTNSVPQTPSTTASVGIARSLSDANSLSSFHASHEERIYLLR